MKMTKILAIVCALLLALTCTACTKEATPSDSGSKAPTLDAIREKGELTFATESTYPPFEFIVIENGETVYVGMDVALGKAVAEKLGVKFVQSEMAFDSIIPAIQAGTVTTSASITPDDERRQVVDFSINYYDTTNCFLVRADEVDAFTSKESFDGKTIGAQQGTNQNTLIVEDMTNAKSLILPKTSTLIQELKVGNIDAICLEKPVADCYAAAYEGQFVVCSYELPVEGGGVAMPVKKGQEDLVEFLNEVIAEMKENGEMQKIYDEAVKLAIDQIVEE